MKVTLLLNDESTPCFFQEDLKLKSLPRLSDQLVYYFSDGQFFKGTVSSVTWTFANKNWDYSVSAKGTFKNFTNGKIGVPP